MTLVVTLALADDAQARLDALRRSHFLPDRNLVPAHVSLFHAVPPDVLDDVRAAAARAPFDVELSGVRSLGRGTALVVASPELDAVHADLRCRWLDLLGPQDRQPFRPHVTVQNRVTPEAARRLQAELARTFAPWSARAVGIDAWHYAGGPWEHVERAAFPGLQAGSSPSAASPCHLVPFRGSGGCERRAPVPACAPSSCPMSLRL